jgi:hypothetical protein
MTDPKTAVAKREAAADELEQDLLAVAKTPEERALAYGALSKYRQSTLIRKAAAAISGTMWGRPLSDVARAAIAAYALETGTDPVRHWRVLGDNLYDLAELWMDIAAAHPDFAGVASQRYIHDDSRATPEERAERLQLRIAYGVPDDTPGACAVVLRTFSRGDFLGVNWVKMHKTSEGKWRDNVGHQEPTLTALTRAWRKAAKKAFPLWFSSHPLRTKIEATLGSERGVEHGLPVNQLPPARGVEADDVDLTPK